MQCTLIFPILALGCIHVPVIISDQPKSKPQTSPTNDFPLFSNPAATHSLKLTLSPPTLYSKPAPSPTRPTGNSPPSVQAAPHGQPTAARFATSSPMAATGLRLLIVPLNLRTRLARRARSRCTMCMRTGIMISVRRGMRASKRRCRGCWGVRELGLRWPTGTK